MAARAAHASRGGRVHQFGITGGATVLAFDALLLFAAWGEA